jgi:beta-xylosidase
MRDPCIARGPDGTFHMVWTTGWWEKGVGLAHSADLVTWSKQEWVPVMEAEPAALNSWAPEIVYSPAAKQFLIFWASTIPGRFPETEATDGDGGPQGQVCNHRMYSTTTVDFRAFSPAALLYDPGFNCIDATIAPAAGRWVMFIKDETKAPVAKKHIRMAWADSPAGPWGPAGPTISPDWVEGPSTLRIGTTWFLYFDAYTRGRYEGLRSEDLKTWHPITPSFPKGARHGTAFGVPPAVAEKLR